MSFRAAPRHRARLVLRRSVRTAAALGVVVAAGAGLSASTSSPTPSGNAGSAWGTSASAATSAAAQALVSGRGSAGGSSRSEDRLAETADSALSQDDAAGTRAADAQAAIEAQAAAQAQAAAEAEAAADAAAAAAAQAAAQAQAAHDAEVAAAQADPRAVAQQMAAERGWGSAQFSCLNSLWTKESGWKYTAENRSSHAYGIPQSLPGTKMATVGEDWRTNPRTQIAWGLGYIASSYGTPCGAWSHSRSHGWY